jgi:DNA-binding response OmpR family regulator
MSGYTGDAVTQRAMVDEGAEFLEKPFTPDTLLRRVDEILRNHRPAGAASQR